jgi:hypothetical protein
MAFSFQMRNSARTATAEDNYGCFRGPRGRSPVSILQFIASGILGASSFRDGLASAALGAGSHFVIAFGAAGVYYMASRKFNFLIQQAVVCGMLYGVAVYLFMNLVVVPLSAVPIKLSYPPSAVMIGLAVHMLCIGLPISLAIRKYSY